MWPPMWTRIAARGLCRSAFASKSSKDMQRSLRLQSTNSTSAPAPIAASGVAMKVLEGQSTVSPLTPANSSAARAPPAQLERPRLGSPFHSLQRRSKASSLAPSDHCSESSTSVQSSNSRARSRWSNPIANLSAAAATGDSGGWQGGANLAAKPDQSSACAAAITAPTVLEPARSIVPPSATAMKPTSATPPSGVSSPRTRRRSAARGSPAPGPGPRTSPARRGYAGRCCRALISLSSASASESSRRGEPGDRDQHRAGRQLVGEQLAGDRRPA